MKSKRKQKATLPPKNQNDKEEVIFPQRSLGNRNRQDPGCFSLLKREFGDSHP